MPQLSRNLGIILLGVWLILHALVSLGFLMIGPLLPLLGVVAGVCILLQQRIGFILLGIWLIVGGLPAAGIIVQVNVLALLALAAGILILLGH